MARISTFSLRKRADIRQAETASRILGAAEPSRPLRATLDDGSDIVIPPAAATLLRDALGRMADGSAVTLLSADAELTTQQAADLLGVSRPYLVRLLDEGAIASRKVGTHRRVRVRDVDTFRAQRAETSERAMKELAEQAQDLRLGY